MTTPTSTDDLFRSSPHHYTTDLSGPAPRDAGTKPLPTIVQLCGDARCVNPKHQERVKETK